MGVVYFFSYIKVVTIFIFIFVIFVTSREMFKLLALLSCASFVFAHDEYRGKCPTFSPMQGFDWNRFKNGRWYAVEKFDTTQSKCITYNFQEDENGFKEIVQNSEITSLERVAVDNKFRYVGKLATPSPSNPANMLVRFQLNFFGSASFVVMDTDYENYALICTCQSKKILFDALTFHRRSCTILQRTPEIDTTIVDEMKDLLNSQVKMDDGELADHDFDNVRHDNCNYNDDEKGLQIDIERIVGDATDGFYDLIEDRGVELIRDGLIALIL